MLLAAIAATIAVYFPGLHGAFMFDDLPNLVNNPQVHLHDLSLADLASASFSSGAGILRRPLSMLTFALNYYFFGPAPFSFKLVNLIIHVLNGIGLYLLGRQLLNAYRHIHHTTLTENSAGWIALAASAAWLLHPLNLTAVLYVVQRMTSLSTLFMIAGLCFYVWGRWRRWNGQNGLALMVTGVIVFGVLALLSKESGALLPLYMFAIEYSLFRFRTRDGAPDRGVRRYFLAFLVAPAIGGLIWMASDPQPFFAGYAFHNFTPTERLLTEARVVVFYLRLICLPSLRQLALYHDDIAISRGLFNPPDTLLSVAFVTALLATGFAVRRRTPLVSLGILWFFAGQVLESTVLPLDIAFEHRNYLADYGILLPACCALLTAGYARRTLGFRRTAAALLIAALAAVTLLRSQLWSNSADQMIAEAHYHPRSPETVYAAGSVYANLALAGARHQFAGLAYRYLERAARLTRTGIMPDAALVIFASKLGEPLNSAWIRTIRRRLARDPIAPDTVGSLKQLQACQMARCAISDRRMMTLFQSAFANRTLPSTPQQFSDVLTIYGSFLINKMDNFEAGKAAFGRAVQVSPGIIQYRLNLIRLLIAMYRYHDARFQLQYLESHNILDRHAAQIAALAGSLARLSDTNRTPAAATHRLSHRGPAGQKG